MKTCIIYLRVSREKDGEKELSINSQLRECEKRAESLNAQVLEVFTDRDKTGRNNNRPGFQAALSYCETNNVDYFIVWSTSRFARNVMYAKQDKHRLMRAGTEVKYATTRADESDDGHLVMGVLEVFDENASRIIAKDTRRSMQQNAADGYFNGGRVPYGFDVEPDPVEKKRKRLVIKKSEAAIVKKIFEMRISGLGAKSIADRLNAEAVFYRDSVWTKTRVTSLLRNKKVIGISVFGKYNHEKIKQPKEKWIEVKSHEPIVDRFTWERVQALMDASVNQEEHGSHKSTRAFTGLLKCGKCKINMKIFSGKGRSQRYYYYCCPNSKNGKQCKTKSIPADKFDKWLIGELSSLLFNPSSIQKMCNEINQRAKNWSTDTEKEKTRLTSNLREIERNNSRLYQAVEQSGDIINLSDIAPRLRHNNARIEQIKNRLAVLDSTPRPTRFQIHPRELSAVLQEQINSKDAKIRRAIISSFVKKITVRGGELQIHYEPESLVNAQTLSVHSRSKWLPDRSLLGTVRMSLHIPDFRMGGNVKRL